MTHISFHNVSDVQSEIVHFPACPEHGEFDRVSIIARRADGEEVRLDLFMADGCKPVISQAT